MCLMASAMCHIIYISTWINLWFNYYEKVKKRIFLTEIGAFSRMCWDNIYKQHIWAQEWDFFILWFELQGKGLRPNFPWDHARIWRMIRILHDGQRCSERMYYVQASFCTYREYGRPKMNNTSACIKYERSGSKQGLKPTQFGWPAILT